MSPVGKKLLWGQGLRLKLGVIGICLQEVNVVSSKVTSVRLFVFWSFRRLLFCSEVPEVFCLIHCKKKNTLKVWIKSNLCFHLCCCHKKPQRAGNVENNQMLQFMHIFSFSVISLAHIDFLFIICRLMFSPQASHLLYFLSFCKGNIWFDPDRVAELRRRWPEIWGRTDR